MTKRTETKTGALIQVMGEPGFDSEIIAKTPNVPQRGVSDIASGKGYWAATGVWKPFVPHLRKCITDQAVVPAHSVVK